MCSLEECLFIYHKSSRTCPLCVLHPLMVRPLAARACMFPSKGTFLCLPILATLEPNTHHCLISVYTNHFVFETRLQTHLIELYGIFLCCMVFYVCPTRICPDICIIIEWLSTFLRASTDNKKTPLVSFVLNHTNIVPGQERVATHIVLSHFSPPPSSTQTFAPLLSSGLSNSRILATP